MNLPDNKVSPQLNQPPIASQGGINSLYLEKVRQSITDGLLVMNKNGDILFCNQPAATLVKLERAEDLIGKNIWIIFPEINVLKQYPAYPSIMQENRSLIFKEYFPAFNNWIELSVYPSDENIVVYFKNVTEIVQRKKMLLLEREVLAMNANPFKDLHQVLDTYIASVAQIYNELPMILWQSQGNSFQTSSSINIPASLINSIGTLKVENSIWPAWRAMEENNAKSNAASGSDSQEVNEILSKHGFIASTAYPVTRHREMPGGCWKYFINRGNKNKLVRLILRCR